MRLQFELLKENGWDVETDDDGITIQPADHDNHIAMKIFENVKRYRDINPREAETLCMELETKIQATQIFKLINRNS